MEYNTTLSLFHYTKSIYILERISKDGLFPNYCAEHFSYKEKEEIVGIPMVSFCDIPLKRINGFSNRYGSYAIGYSKEWGLKNRINPVFYAANEDIVAGLWFLRNYTHELMNNLKRVGSDGRIIKIKLKQGPLPELVDFINHINAKEATMVFYAFMKKYESEHKGK